MTGGSTFGNNSFRGIDKLWFRPPPEDQTAHNACGANGRYRPAWKLIMMRLSYSYRQAG
jgi:hypothetical protein